MAAYPKALYHEDGRVTVVQNLLEQTALGAEWVESPGTFSRGVFSVSASTSAKTLIAANAKRATLKIVNDSDAIMRFKYGTGITNTNLTWILDPGERWEMPLVDGLPEHSGIITAIWESATGAARVTETER